MQVGCLNWNHCTARSISIQRRLPSLPWPCPGKSCTCTWWPWRLTASSSSSKAPDATNWIHNLGTGTFPGTEDFMLKIPLGCLRDTQSLLYGKLQYHNIAEWFQLNQKRTVNVSAKYFLPPKLVFSHHGLALRTTGGGTLKILVTYRLQGRLLRKLLSVIHDVCCYELKALTRPGPDLGVQPDLNQKCISDVYPRRGTSKCT